MEAHQTRAKVYDMLWYDESLLESRSEGETIPLDMWFIRNETASHRSDWGKNARFSVLEAKLLPTSPQSRFNNPNRGIQKLTVYLEGVQELDLSVVFSPDPSNTKRFDPADLKSIGSW